MRKPKANEITELIRALGSRSRTRVDGSRARLSIIGARAVEDLIEALEGENSTIRARVMPLLALIQDARGRGPLVAMLLDRSHRLREIASRCLARFPSPEAVAALNRVLDRERVESVRIAAVQALVEQYAAGQEQAICRVLELLTDTREPASIRLVAFSLLPLLSRSGREGIVERLQSDPVASVRERAASLDFDRDVAEQSSAAELGRLVEQLAADDYAPWNSAVQRLAERGAVAVEPLLAEMQRRAHDPEFCTRAGMALKAMGPRRARRIVDALDTIDDPLPLQVLVEVIGAFGEKASIYRLIDVIERLARRPARPVDAHGLDAMQRVAAKAHLELARVGSRVAIRYLRDALADPERRLELELLAAIELIGKREEIGVLLRAYAHEDDFVRVRIADVVRSIMRREHIRRNSRVFLTFSQEQRQALGTILPPPAVRGRAGGRVRQSSRQASS
jgi:HEAT repeat protein